MPPSRNALATALMPPRNIEPNPVPELPAIHKETVRVLYADTDAMSIAYHGTYFRWFELGRCELMRSMGVVYREFEESGFGLPVVDIHAKFYLPASYDDEITITSWVPELNRASMRFAYLIHRGDTLLTEGFTHHACTNTDGKVVRFPKSFYPKT